MEATTKLGNKRLEEPGRYAITIECADDLSDNELILMLEFFKAEVFGLQDHNRGDEAERKARFSHMAQFMNEQSRLSDA